MSESSNQPGAEQPLTPTTIPPYSQPTPPNPSETPARQNPTPTPNRNSGRGGCAIYLIIILVTTFGGATCGLVCQTVLPLNQRYQSRGMIMIEDKSYTGKIDLDPGTRREEFGYQLIDHHKIMMSKEFVREIFERNDYYKLDTFANMSQDAALEKAVNSLSIKPDPEEPKVYELTFLADHEEESKLFLNSLIVAYEAYLCDSYNGPNPIAKNFRMTTNKIIQLLERANAEYDQLRSTYPAVDLEKGASMTQLNLKSLDSELGSDRKRLAEVEAKNKWVLDALNGDQKEVEIVWILCNEGEIDFRLGPLVPVPQAIIRDIQANITRLKQELAKLRSNNDADPLKIKDLENQISSWESILEKNNAQLKSPLFDSITPADMIRLYIQQNEKQIEDVRSRLEANILRRTELYKQVKSESDGAYLLKRKQEEIDQILAWLQQARTTLALLEPDQLDSLTRVDQTGFRFKVLERAENGKPYRPGLLRWLTGGALSGLIFGLLICLIIQSSKSPR